MRVKHTWGAGACKTCHEFVYHFAPEIATIAPYKVWNLSLRWPGVVASGMYDFAIYDA